jgi:hypothetical protein
MKYRQLYGQTCTLCGSSSHNTYNCMWRRK